MGSQAPLGASPLWNTPGLGLPGPFRSLVRELRKNGVEGDRAYAVAWSQARKWAAKGNQRWVRVVAQLEAARARARATPNKTAHDSARGELALGRTRHVRTPAGARAYDRPIGSPITRRAGAGDRKSSSPSSGSGNSAASEKALAARARLREYLKRDRPDFNKSTSDLQRENKQAVEQVMRDASARGLSSVADLDGLPGAATAARTAAELRARQSAPDTGDLGMDYFFRMQHDAQRRNPEYRPSEYLKTLTDGGVTHGSADQVVRNLQDATAREASGARAGQGFNREVSELDALKGYAESGGSRPDRFDASADYVVTRGGADAARRRAEQADALADYLDMMGVGRARPSRTFRGSGGAGDLASRAGSKGYSENLRDFANAARRAAQRQSRTATSHVAAANLALASSGDGSGKHDLVFFTRRSTPKVLPRGAELGDYPDGYGRVAKRRPATADEERRIARGDWLRVDHAGRGPSDSSYKTTQYRPQLVKAAQEATMPNPCPTCGVDGTALALAVPPALAKANAARKATPPTGTPAAAKSTVQVPQGQEEQFKQLVARILKRPGMTREKAEKAAAAILRNRKAPGGAPPAKAS